jgi:hypothetical protein
MIVMAGLVGQARSVAVIASEAKQSRAIRAALDCFVAAPPLLAMTLAATLS